MGLNIKNQRVHDLAREAARLTGKSQTAVIEEALERLLQERGADPEAAAVSRTIDAVRVIAAEYSHDPGIRDRVIHRVEDLYDDRVGMPR
ncbi:type II toxin-antitoxin system VapB family antitoxin [Ornithinimicrobium cryptoxanthini]|uniref:type II toxin-antitoxin system VapB family antitoxin n=1 Tax=Ornithinimicrobium cryptoxanthini TaxID=2934161 RepID=UPI002118D15C|nr:type II toxin-antitoxin system VapB family antitoxin [Ornithinimicrobium cryptoxanthini]